MMASLAIAKKLTANCSLRVANLRDSFNQWMQRSTTLRHDAFSHQSSMADRNAAAVDPGVAESPLRRRIQIAPPSVDFSNPLRSLPQNTTLGSGGSTTRDLNPVSL